MRVRILFSDFMSDICSAEGCAVVPSTLLCLFCLIVSDCSSRPVKRLLRLFLGMC